MGQLSGHLRFRPRDSTLRANVSKAVRSSSSPMLEIVRRTRPGPAAAPGAAARSGRPRLGEAVRAWVSWMRPTVPGPERRVDPLAQDRQQHLQLRLACGPSTASVKRPPAGPRARASLTGAQIAANSGPAISGQSARSRAWAKPRRAARRCASAPRSARRRGRSRGPARGLVFRPLRCAVVVGHDSAPSGHEASGGRAACQGERMGAAADRPPARAARLVRPGGAGAALARAARQPGAARPLPRLALRGDAAADDRRRGRAATSRPSSPAGRRSARSPPRPTPR